MIKVYFETGVHAEVIATFADEELYEACSKELEAHAKKHRGFITESVQEERGMNSIDDLIGKLEDYEGSDFVVNDSLLSFIKKFFEQF